MVKYGTNAQGSHLECDENADTLNRRFISQTKSTSVSRISPWELWTKERVEEHYHRLEAGGGEVWDRWTAVEEDDEEVHRVLNDY